MQGQDTVLFPSLCLSIDLFHVLSLTLCFASFLVCLCFVAPLFSYLIIPSNHPLHISPIFIIFSPFGCLIFPSLALVFSLFIICSIYSTASSLISATSLPHLFLLFPILYPPCKTQREFPKEERREKMESLVPSHLSIGQHVLDRYIARHKTRERGCGVRRGKWRQEGGGGGMK